MKPVDAFFAGLTTMFIIWFVGMVIIKNNDSKPVEQPPGIYLDDNRVTRMYILKDTRRNLQWDAFEYGHSLIIIPGTEKPIKPIKYGKSLNEVIDEQELLIRNKDK